MRKLTRIFLIAVTAAAAAIPAMAQDGGSTATMRRGSRNPRQQQDATPGVTTRMQQRLQSTPKSEADMSWMKVIYRDLDLSKPENAPLYFPEQPVDGNESLFRMIIRLTANGQLDVYEYLDGREVFTDQYKVKIKDILDRFHIYYQNAKGSTERNPRFVIEESDVPANEVLSYYIIERWEFDTRTNRMMTRVEALCPVLHRNDDYGMEALKYPMFWVKFDDIRPYLSNQNIFTSDYNNMPTCTYDDYFQLGLYDGDIYKTRNLRNRSMRQLYPNPDALKHAQDSIQRQLDTFEDKLWVPSMEELEARREKLAEIEAAKESGSDSTSVATQEVKEKKRVSTGRRGKKTERPVKAKRGKPKKAVKEAKSNSSAPVRSVRNRKR